MNHDVNRNGRKSRLFARTPLSLLISASLFATGTMAANSWLSKSVVVEQNKNQISRYSTNKSKVNAVTNSDQTLFDVTISLHNAPAGDDDPSTSVGDEQEVHEQIIGFFADAVCEQTNGAHKIRQVSVFRDKKHQAKADIIWNQTEWPRANLAGFGANGMHIYFGDVFPGGSGGGVDKNMLDDAEGAGYTLAHEWGHYAYGLFDEYRGNANAAAGASTPQNTDLPPTPSIMNSQWTALSEGARWLNHSTANNFGDPARTAQGRVYGKSGWEILVQDPKDDPKSGQRTAQPERTRYSALDAAQPDETDSWIRQELPTAQPDCRSELDIVWVDGDIDMQIVIDRSGSMGGTAIGNARQAAKLLVDATAEGNTSLGVVSFSNNVRQDSPVRPIPSPGDVVKAEIKDTIDSISATGTTALYDGSQLALDNLLAYQANNATGAPGVVFVLADGDDNASSYSEGTVITNYQNADIPIFSFGYGGASPTGPLLNLANGTGGKYFASPTTLAEITDAFLQANALATDSQNLADVSESVPASGATDFDLLVDSGIANISLFFSHDGALDDVSYRIADANGDAVLADFECTSLTNAVSCTANIDEAAISSAATGSWTLRAVNAAASDLTLSFNASAEPTDEGTFNVSVEGADGNEVAYPAPMILTTAITRDRAVTGVNVTASVVDPYNRESVIKMVDDGTNGDGTADDGIYSAIVPYRINGLYQVEVLVDNSAMNARYTTVGLLSANVDGTQPVAPVLPAIQEDFYRVSKTSLVVTDVPYSDGDNTTGGANLVVADNTGVDSQINNAGDEDYFYAENIDTTQPLFIRLTDLSLGMQPLVTVLADDAVTEIITDASLATHLSTTGYLYVEIPGDDLTSTVYVKVSHEDSDAAIGGYQISMGPQLNTDVPPNQIPVAAEDSAEVYVGEEVTLDVLANDTDADGDGITLVSIDSGNAAGVLTQNAEGTVTFSAATGYGDLAPGDRLGELMSYIISDGNGGFSQGAISVTVRANALPVAANDTADVAETGTVAISPLSNDSDPDGHTISMVSIDDSGLTGTLTDNGDGSYTYDPAGNFNLLAEGESDTESLTYTVRDEKGAESTGSITITINGENQAPTAENDTAQVSESSTVTIDVLANDTDPDMDTLSVTSVDVSSASGTATVDAAGTITYSPNGAFDSLNNGQTGTDTFTYTMTDGAESVSATVTVTISGVTPPSQQNSSSGGSGGGSMFWLLPMFAVIAARRVKRG